MAATTPVVLKQNATGTIWSFTLTDELGAVNLTSFQFVKLTLRQPGIAPAVDRGMCNIDPDQVTNKGFVSFSFDSTTSAIPDGTYNLEFYGRDGNGKDYYWPTDANFPYGTAIVETHLA